MLLTLRSLSQPSGPGRGTSIKICKAQLHNNPNSKSGRAIQSNRGRSSIKARALEVVRSSEYVDHLEVAGMCDSLYPNPPGPGAKGGQPPRSGQPQLLEYSKALHFLLVLTTLAQQVKVVLYLSSPPAPEGWDRRLPHIRISLLPAWLG